MATSKRVSTTALLKKATTLIKTHGTSYQTATTGNLLREAVDMRLNQGKTNEEIADFLNDFILSEHVHADDEYRIAKMTKSKVGNLFEDPFYFGLIPTWQTIADLVDVYDFLPLITPDEYILLNREAADDFGKEYAGKGSAAARLEYGLLRGKVICDFCESIMQFQHQQIKRGKNKGMWLISWYCRNRQNCIRHNDKAAIEEYGRSSKRVLGVSWLYHRLKKCSGNVPKRARKPTSFT